MNPALEYVTRTNLIKSWFKPPCSIFLENDESKVIVTICKCKSSYKIRNWTLADCNKNDLLPKHKEYVIEKSEIYSHPNVVIKNYRPIFYKSQSIPTSYNSYRSPMSADIYEHFFDNAINGFNHQKARKLWLWQQFLKIYLPELCALQGYISEYGSESDIVIEQMELVKKYFQTIWLNWIKWENYFLIPMPGELIFSKEYRMLTARC